MPTPAAETVTTWRTKRHQSTLHLYLHCPAVVFAARINQTSFSYPLLSFSYDGVTAGAYTDVRVGQTVLLGTTAGAYDLGIQRVRLVPTASTFYIGWSSRGRRMGEVRLADDAYLTVVDEFRPWAKIPRILPNGTMYKDGDLSLGTFGTQPPPVANGGTGYIGFVAADSGVITVSFSAVDSFAVAPSATLTGYAWDIEDGTLTSGTLTSSSLTATFPAGFRYVHLTVTDSNGKTHSTHLPVKACTRTGGNAPVRHFELTEYRRLPQWTQASFTVREDISDFIPGGLVMCFAEDWYGTDAGSLAGPSGREHIRLIGFASQEPTSIRADASGVVGETVISAASAAFAFSQRPGFRQIVRRKASPAVWTEMSQPNIDRFLHYLLHWHSTALDIAPWSWSGLGATYPVMELASEKGSIFQQVNQRAEAIACALTCDSRGRLRTPRDPMLINTASRTSAVMVSLAETDWTDLEYVDAQEPQTHWIRGSAVVASATKVSSVFCDAPGPAPGQGSGSEQTNYQLVASQSELNQREGHRYRRKNAPQHVFRITLVHSGDLDLQPAYLEWVALTISAEAAAQHGLTFTSARCLLLEASASVSAEDGSWTWMLTLEREIALDDEAVTYTPPPVSSTAPALPDMPPFPAYPNIVFPDFGTLFPDAGIVPPAYNVNPYAPVTYKAPKDGNTLLLLDASGVHITLNGLQETPDWHEVTPDTLEAEDTLAMALFDPLRDGGAYLLVHRNTADETGTWSQAFDFTTGSAQGWTLDPARTWADLPVLSGAGWKYGRSSNISFPWTLWIMRTFAARDISSITIAGTQTNPSAVQSGSFAWFVDLYRNGMLVDRRQLGDATPNSGSYTRTETYVPPIEADEIRLESNRFSNIVVPDPYLTSLTLEGDGGNPFGTSTLTFRTDNIFARAVTWVEGDVVSDAFDALLLGSGRDQLMLYNAGTGKVRYSSDRGAALGAEVSVGASFVGTAPGGALARLGTVSLFAGSEVVRKATSYGGSYSDEANGAVAGTYPICLLIPLMQFGSKTARNSGASPQYLLGTPAEVGGAALWKVTASGKTDITPASGAVIPVAQAAAVSSFNGAEIAVLAEVSGELRLYRTSTTGLLWTNMGAVTGARMLKMRRGDRDGRQIYLISGEKLYYVDKRSGTVGSSNERGLPDGIGTLLYMDVYG